jgi:hypothetical protein
MKTSRVIKEGQSQELRAAIIASGQNQWAVEGREGDLYHVMRVEHNLFTCDCQAGQRGLLCRHVTAVVKQLTESAHMTRVAVWTSEDDARKQRRPMLKLKLAGRRSFWVTYTWPSWVTRCSGKIMKVKNGTPGRADVYYQKGQSVWRQSCQMGG